MSTITTDLCGVFNRLSKLPRAITTDEQTLGLSLAVDEAPSPRTDDEDDDYDFCEFDNQDTICASRATDLKLEFRRTRIYLRPQVSSTESSLSTGRITAFYTISPLSLADVPNFP